LKCLEPESLQAFAAGCCVSSFWDENQVMLKYSKGTPFPGPVLRYIDLELFKKKSSTQQFSDEKSESQIRRGCWEP
jgi:hypothetical protein